MYSISLFFIPRSSLGRCNELMIPAVTVLLNFNGLPKAATSSPGRKSDDEPRPTWGNLI